MQGREEENVPSRNKIVHPSLTGGCKDGLANSSLEKEDLCLDWEVEIRPFQWDICPQTPPSYSLEQYHQLMALQCFGLSLGLVWPEPCLKFLKMCCQYLKSRLFIEKFKLGASLKGLTALVLHSHLSTLGWL